MSEHVHEWEPVTAYYVYFAGWPYARCDCGKWYTVENKPEVLESVREYLKASGPGYWD